MIVKHLLDTLILTIWMLVVGLAFVGWGELVRRWLKFKPTNHPAESTATKILCDIWLGLCICISLTELLHFFFAITWVVSLGVLGAGVVYSLVRGELRNASQQLMASRVKHFSIVHGLYGFALLAACFIWISAALVGPGNYDSGLYHFGSIKWFNEHSITYGLVNLHTRLAYNQSYFALIALLNFSPLYDRAYAGTGVFLFILTAATCVQLVRKTTLHTTFLLFVLLVLAGGFILKASSPTPDLAVGLFQVVIFFVLLAIFFAPAKHHLLPPLFILSVSALTIKLSMVAFCAAAVCIAYRPVWQLLKNNLPLTVRLLILCALILLIHALRGYALSGVPFYPSTFGALWSLPYAPDAAQVIAEANSIYSWARLPGVPPATVLSNWDWFAPWLGQLPARFSVLMGLGATLLSLNLLMLTLNGATKQLKAAHVLYAPLLLSLLFWFFTAPDVRFLGLVPELIVSLGAWLFWCAIKQPIIAYLQTHWLRYRAILWVGFIAFIAIAVIYALKLQTGLGLGQYFYVHDILYGLSQIGIDSTFFVAMIAGVLLCGYQYHSDKNSVDINASFNRYAIWARLGHHILTCLFICGALVYISNVALLKRDHLAGWVAIPTEPYDREQLKTGLFVNVPKSDDLCWQTPLPCLPRQQLNPQLQMVPISSKSSLLPNSQLFKLMP